MSSPKHIAIAVVERGPSFEEVLIGRRPPGVPLSGLWEFPGGKVRPDESFEAAAVRECQEETGLQVRIVGEFPKVNHRYDHATVRLHFFRCRLLGEVTRPGGTFRWIKKSRLPDFDFPEANGALLQLLRSQS